MLYTYTPEIVGGTIIIDAPSGKFYKDDFYVGESLVSVSNYENGLLLIRVFEKTKTVRLTTNRELKFRKHATDNYYYPIFGENGKTEG